MTRRQLLKRLALGGSTLVMAGGGLYAWQIEPNWVEVTSVDLPIRGLNREFHGYRIAHVSDPHAGRDVSPAYLQECMDRITSLKPDVIVITGDLITGGLSGQIATVAGLLNRLRAPDGLMVSLGNHDYHSWSPGRIRYDVADRLVAAVRQVGGRVLRNQSHTLSRGPARLTFVGLDELFVNRCDPKTAFAGVSTDLPIIMLSHNPDSVEILRHCPGQVILSGHTHGGQVCLPFLGPPHLPVHNRRYASGLIHVDEKLVYVTRGLGHLTKVRFNCRPEITVHRLHSVSLR